MQGKELAQNDIYQTAYKNATNTEKVVLTVIAVTNKM
jgi:hypothetical protein